LQSRSVERSFTRGVAWMSAGSLAARAVTLIGSVMLARLLLPEHFGLFSAAMVVIGVVQLVTDLGLGQALIAYPGDTRKAASSIFYAILATAGAAAFVVWVFADALAAVMRQPMLASVLRALAVNVVVMAAASVPLALMQKAHRWRGQAILEFTTPIVSTSIMVSLAFLGFGAWSIVYGYVARAVTMLVGVWWLSRWRPALEMDWTVFASLFRFGKWIVLDRLSAFVLLTMDNLYLARWQGTKTLGYYALPYNWVNLPVQQVVLQSQKVLFPVLTQLEDAQARAEMLLKACRMFSFFVAPIYLFWLLNASLFVEGLFGPKWLPCVPVLQWLSVYALAHALAGGLMGSFYWAMKRPELAVFPFWAAIAVATAGLVYGGGRWGAVEVAQLFTLAMYVRASMMIYGLVRFYHVPLSNVLRAVTDGWLAALLASLSAATLSHLMRAPAPVELAMGIVLHANLYLLVQGWLKYRKPLQYYRLAEWRTTLPNAGKASPTS
jgi:teichuronic acid exporter